MSISITDPLALVAIQAGQVGTPAREAAAAGGEDLDSQQRAVVIGEPVLIVFGRRRTVGGIAAGGVLISPGATECRFENDSSNNVTAFYHLVLSEGQIDSIPVKDVFQGPCRVGSHTQTYGRRAGTWEPGNFITQIEIASVQFSFDSWDAPNPTWYNATQIDGIWRYFIGGTEYVMGQGAGKVQRIRQTSGIDMPKPDAPSHCGSKGSYPDMSTMSFQMTVPNKSDFWNRQVHCFIRGGMHVTRLYDNTTGASDNFADLVYWMLTNSGRVPAALIDTTALGAAATFLETNGFTCNCCIKESTNYADLLTKWAPYFLLCESNSSGKRGIRAVLPTTEAGAIDTGVITPKWTFTEDHITAGSLEIQYSNLAERQPFVAQVIWRQQLEDDFGFVRTAEVRYSGTAQAGPYESHDLSEFCTTENHAVKVGAYILSKRTRTSHTIRFSAKPQGHNTLVTAGDIIRVRLARQATTAGTGYHDFLYQVERITKTLAGELSYECTHFPVNTEGASLIALDVAAATGSGILLPSNKTGEGCDLNSADDNTVPSESWSGSDGVDDGQTTLPSGTSDEAEPGTVEPNPPESPVYLGPLTPGTTPGSFEQPEGMCEGGQIWLSTADLDANGEIIPGTLQQIERPDWTIPISLMGNNKYYSFYVVCPNDQTQTTDPIKDVFYEKGDYSIGIYRTSVKSDAFLCGTGAKVNSASTYTRADGYVYRNVESISIQILGTATLEYRCNQPPTQDFEYIYLYKVTGALENGTAINEGYSTADGYTWDEVQWQLVRKTNSEYVSRVTVSFNGERISDRTYEMEEPTS